MDRLTQLRGEAGGSRDSTLDTSAAVSEAYMTANESSIYVSLSEEDPSFDISTIKDVSLASTVSSEKSGNDQLVSDVSPIANKTDLLDSFKIGKQIEAANILSGGVNIFDDNDNSYDGNELVIDCNMEIDEKSNPDLKLVESSELPFQKTEELVEALEPEAVAIVIKDTEVVLQIDGKCLNAINIGNGLYLYRKTGEEELAAVQVMNDDGQDHPTFKFLKVRENAEGNLEVYEEIEIEVPVKGGKINDKGASIKGINKVIKDSSSNKVVERKNLTLAAAPTASSSKDANSEKVATSAIKSEVNLNGKMVKLNETRKSPVIHSTPNKEGIPLTKTMVDQQLHPNRQLDNVKTIEVHTDPSKQRTSDSKSKDVPANNKPAYIISKEKETVEVAKFCEKSADNERKTIEIVKPKPLEVEGTKATLVGATKIIMEQLLGETTTITTDKAKVKSGNPESKPCEESEIKLTSTSEIKIDNTPNKTHETVHSAVLELKSNEDPKLTHLTQKLENKSIQILQTEPSAEEELQMNEGPKLKLTRTSETKLKNKSIKIFETEPSPEVELNLNEDSKLKPTSTLEIKLENKSVQILETESSPVVEVKWTEAKKTDTVDAFVPKPNETPQVQPMKSSDGKPIEISQPKAKETSQTKIRHPETRPSTVCEDSVITAVPKSTSQDIGGITTAKNVAIVSGESLNCKPSAKSKIEEDSNTLKVETNEKEVEKTSDMKSNKIIKETVGKNEITDILPVKSKETSGLKSDPISSDSAQSDTKNDPQKKDVIDEGNGSSKIIRKQSKQMLQQNQEPKSIVVQDVDQPQVKVSSPLEVKTEPKPKGNPTTEKALEPLQENPASEGNVLVASLASAPIKSANPTTNESITHKNELDQKVKIVENIILLPPSRKDIVENKPLNIIDLKNVKAETKIITLSDKNKQHSISEKSELKAVVISEKPLQILNNQDKQVEQNVSQTTFDSAKNTPKQESIEKLSTLKQEIPKSHSKPLKMEIINEPILNVQPALPKKTDVKNETPKVIVLDKKSINNNNAAVPFGKWTEANRQEFLNKIKEAKVPATSNTKQIKQANDLNRRDVLQKFASQRQSNNASSKAHEPVKGHIKNEGSFVHKPTVSNPTLAFRETKASVKAEAPAQKTKPLLLKKPEKPDTAQTSKVQTNLTVTSSYMLKSEGSQRNEFNNQDLIDKTIEGIINRVVTGKPQDLKQNIPKEQVHPPREHVHPPREQVHPPREQVHPPREQVHPPREHIHPPKETVNFKAKEKHPSMLSDVIEMKMNELHGIPFVERPPHQLPKVYNRDIKTYSKLDNSSSNKASKIPSLLSVAASSQPKPVNVKEKIIDLDLEDEIIEHEPVTGDIDFHKNIEASKPATIVPTSVPKAPYSVEFSKKDSIITEKDFDKFYRRNSVTYSSDLYPNTKITSSTAAVDFGAKKIASRLPAHKPLYTNVPTSKIQMTSKLVPVGEDMFGKNYPSKLQMAYQTALSSKHEIDHPVTIIEDKPVKVVFMDANSEFPSVHLNVQGQQLSPSKKPIDPRTPELDSLTTSTCDSLDSDILDSIEGKVPDEAKSKTKHQRKQVLTPVEAPELELIAPCDLGIEVSPKKKKRTEDSKEDKQSKSVVPKKSYLLGRNINEDTLVLQTVTKDIPKEIASVNSLIVRSDAASAIDNLVKAAELLETQSASFKPESLSSSNPDSPQTVTPTPVKRGRGRPRKYPLPDGTSDKTKVPSPQKKPRLIDAKQKKRMSTSDDDESSSDDMMVKENWTMGKINENIVCPICSKLFRSENVVFKHVKHCTGPSPNRSDSDKRSARRSRYSRDSQSVDSKDDTDGESDKPLKKSTPKKRQSIEPSPDRIEDVIEIEDTPVKDKKEKPEEPKQHEPRKPTKTKAQYKVSGLSCEHCGKTFRQLSYLVSHKLLHKKTNSKVPGNETQTADKTVFSCEICKKEFRKLHHLVQHRLIHNSSQSLKPSRKNSAEQTLDNKATKEQDAKQNDDQSAAFRCEPCDKSFRKLHHLVEHRETHDGINRQKNISTSQSVSEKPVAEPPPQCDICKKTFRKVHHLSEHKEQHMDLSSEKFDEKGSKSALSTKDIIHECSLCYMVFPNEHSLNKHFVNCQKKKRQSAAKLAKQPEEGESVANKKTSEEIESVTAVPPTSPKQIENIATETPENIENAKHIIPEKIEEIAETKQKRLSKEQESKATDQSIPPKASKRDLEEQAHAIEKTIDDVSEVPTKVKKTEEKSTKEVKETELPKKKTPVKENEQAITGKRRKSNLPFTRIEEKIAVESSDDDEVRYMFNPDFKHPETEPDVALSQGNLFMKVRSNKRNSLHFDQPKPKVVKRRISTFNPSKVTRKSKSTETTVESLNIIPAAKPEVPATDSDDSEVKYSFPAKTQNPAETDKTEKTPKIPKEKRRSLVEKRKTVGGIARRKSVGKTPAAPTKEVKKRRGEVEHRCDCGQLFSSAALLARHATLAHTPPRNRRPRRPDSPPPPPPAPAPFTPAPPPTKPTDSNTPTDKTARKKPGRPPGKTPPVRKSVIPEPTTKPVYKVRKAGPHRGVPVPEKMKKLIEKSKK